MKMRPPVLVVLAFIGFATAFWGCASNPRDEPADLPSECGDETGDCGVDRDVDPADTEAEPFDPAALQYPFCPVDESEIDRIYDRMTPRQRIGQHLSMHIVRKGERVDPEYEAKMRSCLPGAVSVAQVTGVAPDSPQATGRFLHHAQSIAAEISGVPLFISSDQEGGVYTSVNHVTGGTDSIGPTAIGATRDEWVAFNQFDMMGREVKAVGINMNFGPLLDTHYQRDNGNLNTRTFGPDMELNTRLGVAAISGFRHNLVLPMAKHFPGDGMTRGNPHHEFVINTATKEELERNLLGPFRAAILAGCDAVMMMPAQFTALDDQRAAITSRAVITGFLRGEIGFAGLVVSDDLSMYGARLGLSKDQSQGVEALKAGTDILLTGGEEIETTVTLIEEELRTGGITETEFAASTRRILRYKQKYCLLDKPTYPDEADIATLSARIGTPQDARMSATHAERAVVMLKNDGILPLVQKRVLCIGPFAFLPDPASGWSWVLEESFCSVMKRLDPSVEAQDYLVGGGESLAATFVEEQRSTADVVVVATFQSYFSSEQKALLDAVLDSSGLPVVHVAQGVPFDALQTRQRAAAVLALQGSLPVMLEAGVRVLFGQTIAGGEMLYDLAD